MGVFKKGILGFVLTTSIVLASERDDLKFLDELFKQKRYSVAVDESKNFLNKYPNSKYAKEIQLRLAKLYFLERDYENSKQLFLIVKDNYKNSKKETEELSSYLARIYAAQGDDNNTLRFLEQAGNDEKNFYDVGNAYLNNENYPKAQEFFQKVLSQKGKYYGETLLNMALATYNNSQYQTTLQYLNEYNGRNEKDKNVILMNYLYGFSYYKLGDINKAVGYFTGIVNQQAASSYGKKSALALIEIYSNRGEITKAIEILAKLGGTREEVEGIRIIGNYYLANKNYGRAADYYERIIHVPNPAVYYNYAFSLYSLGKEKEAIKNFEKLKNTRYESQALYYIAASNYKLKNYSQIFAERNSLRKLKLSKEESESLETIIANSAYELGDYEIAKGIYRDVYSKNPSIENLYRIAVLNSRLEESQEVIKQFTEYRNSFSGDKEYKKRMYMLAGDTFYKQNDSAKAEAIYKDYLATENDLDILDRLVTVLLQSQKYSELMEYLNVQEANSQNRYLKGIASMGMGNYDEAEMYFANVTVPEEKDHELKVKAKYNSVKNIFLKGDYKRAIEMGETYLSEGNEHNREDILDRLAIGNFRLDNFEKSREYFNRLKGEKGYSEYAQFQIAETFYNEKKYDQARNEYRKTYLETPQGSYTEKARYWELNALHNLGNEAEFKKLSNEFMKLYPTSTLKDNVLFILAEISQKNGQIDETIKNYKDLYSSSNKDMVREEAVIKIVELNETKNNLNEGLKWTEKFTDEIKKSYYRASLLEKKGDNEGAFKEYQKLADKPEYKDFALQGMGSYWLIKGDLDKSQKHFEDVMKISNSFYKDFAQYQLAVISEKKGNLPEAVRSYTKVYVMYPQSDLAEVAQLKVGELNEKQGKEKDALSIFEELYEKGQKNEYKVFLLEKIIYLSLKNSEEVKAKNYHDKLKKIDSKTAQKYNDYFKGGK